MDTEPFVRTIGRYEVLGVVGGGGMGVVYRAVDPAIGRPVAIKMLKGSFAGDRGLLERFYHEAKSTGNLQHKNIVTVFALGDQDGMPYLVMEYLEGEPISEIISLRRALPLVQKLEIIIQICDGLHYAHGRNLIHRDIKPANVIVLPDGTSKIVDFGIARAAAGQGLTQTGQVIGTPFYMSPEQINAEPLDSRTDVFSTGVVLYELLTYELPFKGNDTPSTVMKILSGTAPPLSNYLQEYPRELDEIITRVLAKRVEDRYASAEELGFDLLQVQRDLKEGTASSYLQAAEGCMKRGDLEHARLQLQEVLRLDRQNERANRLLRELRQVLQQQQRRSQVAQMRSQAQVALAGQHYEEALACAEQAYRLDPTNPESERLRNEIQSTITRAQRVRKLLNRVESSMYAGELEDAKRAADEALALAPDDSQAKALASAVEKELAVRSRRAAIQSFVDNAREEISARNFERALDHLHEAERLDPSDSNVAELLRWANRGKEQEERRRALQDVLDHINEALVAEDFVSACTMCEMGLAESPGEPALLKLRAIAERQRDVAKRRRFVQEQSVVARQFAESGEHEAALALLADALHRYPDEPNLETLRALISGELEMLTRERVEREQREASEEAARQLAAETRQRALTKAAELRQCLDEQQNFAAATSIASEVEQMLASELLDQRTRETVSAIFVEFRSRVAARDRAEEELKRLVVAGEASPNGVLRDQAGERALAIQAAYPNDQQIQALYSVVRTNLKQWSQRLEETLSELTSIAQSLPRMDLAQAESSRKRAEELAAPFGSDPQFGSVLQQIRNECLRRERERHRVVKELEAFDSRISHTQSLAELNNLLHQADALASAQESDPAVSSALSNLKAAAEERCATLETLLKKADQIVAEVQKAATVVLAEKLLDQGIRLAAENPENLDLQDALTRLSGEVRGRRAEHDLIVQELRSLQTSLWESHSIEDLPQIRRRTDECRSKHPHDPEITALCEQIDSAATHREFVQEQTVLARGTADAGQHESALQLVDEALRRYPDDPVLTRTKLELAGEFEALQRQRRHDAEKADQRLAVKAKQQVLRSITQLRSFLDEQQDLAVAGNAASELQQLLNSEVLDHRTRDQGAMILAEFQSRVVARDQVLSELRQLTQADYPDPARRHEASKRAHALLGTYPNDPTVQGSYAAVSANLERWSYRHSETLRELTNLANSLRQLSVDEAETSVRRAEEIASPFTSDPDISSLLQQIQEAYDHRQRALEVLEMLRSDLSQTRSRAEVDSLLNQVNSRVSTQESDAAVSSALARLQAAGQEQRRMLDALAPQADATTEHKASITGGTLPDRDNRTAQEQADGLKLHEVHATSKREAHEQQGAHTWPTDILSQIEKQLSLFIGPIATVIVRRAASKATTWDELFAFSIESLDTEHERQEFLAYKQHVVPNLTATQPPDLHSGIVAGSGLKTHLQSELNPAVVPRATRLLSKYVGPISSVLVRKALKGADSERSLYLLLAKELDGEAERTQFLRDAGIQEED